MAVNNTLITKDDEPKTLSKFLAQEKIQASLIATLGNEKSKQRFVANIMSATSVNPTLQKCDFSTIIACGYLAESLKLSLSPSLGLAYMVPYDDKKNNRTVAQFQLGYKGYVQLALRSGYYADMDVIEVKQGEYLGKDSLTAQPRFKFIEDDVQRDKLETIGYMAYFVYLNGFKKVIYWTVDKVLNHADTYSKAFSLKAQNGKVSYADYKAGKVSQSDMWKYSSFWYKDFDAMAKKTVLKSLISKWGIMSIEMQTAFEKDIEVDEPFNDTQASIEDEFFGNAGNGLLPTESVGELTELVDEQPVTASKKATKKTEQITIFDGDK